MTGLVVRSERSLVRAKSGSHRHLVVKVNAPKLAGTAARRPMNLAFVLDRSGSMAHGKLDFAKGAALEGIGRLQQSDRFAVVVYDQEIDVTTPSTLATETSKREATRALNEVHARGSTDLCSGWLTGCRQIAARLDETHVARALLFTDGQANHGETGHEALAQHAAELRARGIVTSTFGIGLDFDERLLRTIADAGGGNARFIESNADFARLLREELSDTMDVVHRGLILHIQTPHGPLGEAIGVEVVGPWPVTKREGGFDVALGDLVSEEQLEFVLRIMLPPGAVGTTAELQFSLSERDGAVESPAASAGWTWETHDANDRQPRDVAVDRLVAARHADRAREAAVLANRGRDYGAAKRLLIRVADRIGGYAGHDSILREIEATLRADAVKYSTIMDGRSQKEAYYQSTSSLRGRTASGSATRHPRHEEPGE
ncbi:hypothetical protein LBMAG42_35000 [Deltaproteobacteria bacterium]|nr:hypothetical protein LBMAG42_35000 [Deltaproteobacteria bacterium]